MCEDLALDEELLRKIDKNTDDLSATETEAVNLLYVAVTRCENAIKLDPSVRMNLKHLNETLKDRRSAQAEEQVSSAPAMG